MSLRGTLDFQKPISAESEEVQIFYPFEGGNYFVLPDALIVATRNNGYVDFSLELVRGQSPDLPPVPYGVIDFKLQASYPIEKGIAALRHNNLPATLTPATCTGGFLRWRPLGNFDNVPDELRLPVALRWNTLGNLRFITKVSPLTITLLKNSLLSNVVSFQAIAELEVSGVAPRLALQVLFNPQVLLTALHKLANANNQIAYEAIKNFFRQNLETLPLVIEGDKDIQQLQEFAETMLDWTRVRFGTFVPSPEDVTGAFMTLATPESVGSGEFKWDLSQAINAPRVIRLMLNPLAAAQQLVLQNGMNSVWHETIVPPLKTGNLFVLITANLPAFRPNVLAVGVTLLAPARPPFRMQSINQTIDLQLPDDKGKTVLRLSPAEPSGYNYQTFIFIKGLKGIERLNGITTPHSGEHLDLTIDEFPVSFVMVEATPQLLELSAIHIHVLQTKKETELSFTLNVQQPSIAIALPKQIEGLTFDIEARATNIDKILHLTDVPFTSFSIGLHSFAEYGTHQVEIDCVFDDLKSLVVIDLLPEDSDETNEPDLVFLTPVQSKKTWSYVARSPFRAGYRYRFHHETIKNSWSDIQPYFSNLILRSSEIPV